MMLRLAWKNMWRNRQRTTINMAAILFAVVLSILTSSLKTGIFDNLVQNLVGFYSGYIQIHRKGYWDEQVMENTFQQTGEVEHIVLGDPRIPALTPRLESFALISAGELTKGCLVVGSDYQSENRITRLSSRITEVVAAGTDNHSVIMAEGLLRRLKIKPGDTVVLLGQGYHGTTAAGKYRVSAALRFGSPALDDKILFMTLPAAQELFSATGMITTYSLAINRPKELDAIANDLRGRLGDAFEIMTWQQMMPDIHQHIRNDSTNMRIVQGILYLLICFGLFSTTMMMMAERRHEMGLLIALGMKPGRLAVMLMAESMMTIFSGCLLGILAAVPIVNVLSRHPLRITGTSAQAYERFGFEPVFPTSTDPSHFTSQAAVILLLGLILSLYPASVAMKLDPVKAMRN